MAGILHDWFGDNVSALAYSFARAHAVPGFPQLQPPFNDVAEFIHRQHGQMPDYLRFPLAALTLGFDVASIPYTRGFFHSRSPELRRTRIDAWKHSRLGPQRDLMRYFESLAIVALYGRPQSLMADALPRDGVEANAQQASVVLEEPKPEMRCEIAVIGSGPGGAITACLLAEAGRDVLLIEEGPFHAADYPEPFSREEMLEKYRNGGQTVAFGKTKISYVEGRCVGGGSEVNSGLYHRTPAEVLDVWRREYQVAGLADSDMQPHFEACERDVTISYMPIAAPPASMKLHEGATQLGWKSLEVPRWFRYAGKDSGHGQRQTMARTFVPRFLKARGRLMPGVRVGQIRRDGNGWLLDARSGCAGTMRIQAGTLFVCAGAVHTPALLRRSGITRNIGDSLRLHPTVKMTARFSSDVNASDMGVPVHQVKEFSPRLSFGCSISSPAYLALGMLDHPEHAADVRDHWRQMANYYAMITGTGQGMVRPVPGFRDPLVRYQLTSRDRADLADGLRKLADILFASGATALYPSLTHGPQLLRREDSGRLPAVLPDGLASLMTIHLFSSCPMGENRALCAADSFGRVHGFENLYLADASLLCTAPGVNPQGSIMAITRRNVLKFLGKL